MLNRFTSRRAVIRLFALAAVTMASLMQTQRSQASEDVVADFLKSRIWWADVGTFSNKPFGYMYMFGTQQQPSGDGWYTGTRVTFTGVSNPTTVLGFAWKPTADGVIIDHAYSTEQIRITGVYPEYEAITISGGITSFWTTTRSQFTPETIRRYYWW